MSRSVGAAAAAGLESGFGMGLRMRDQELQEKEIARRAKQQDEDRTYLLEERARKRQQDDDDLALKAIEDQYAALRDKGDGLIQQYGGWDKVPTEIADPYNREVGELTATRRQVMERRYAPLVQQRQQKLADLSSRLQAGQLDLGSVPDAELHQAVTTAARRDPRDLLSVNGKPSVVGQAVTDIMTGIETGNEQMTLTGANALLAPGLKVGVGETSPHGGKIVGKEIVKLIPHPNDPNKFMPVVKVYVSMGKDFRGPIPEGVPKGATGYYIAPVTENRSSDPEDTVKAIDINDAMDYAGRMQTLSTVLSQPGIREKLERGAAEADKAPDNFLTAFYAVKGRMPAKQIEWKSVPQGGSLIGVNPQTGQQVSRIEGLPKPAGASALSANIDAVEQYAQEHGLTVEQAGRKLQGLGLIKTPKGGGGGGGSGGGSGGGGLPTNRATSKLTGEAFLATLPAGEQHIVKGLADGSIKPSEISTKGNRREQMLAKVKQFQADADLSGRGGEAFKNENALRDEFQKAGGNFIKIRDAYGLVQAAAKDPSAAGDMALIFSFMRILDPNSVVREGEFASAQNAAGVPDRVRNAWNRLLNGERLSPGQRTDFTNQARKIFQEQSEQHQVLEGSYRDMAKRYRLNADNVVAPLGRTPGAAPAGRPSLPATNARGWRLMTDARGNRAYVSPDGKSFEEVR